ncbi:sensor histidine kinase [Serinicoccus kebangsaanensis]|uniref:sensor histidine kinase n=1 Tax=Serinicoccus kebangsaanensis TaxID=2602069 RepID=UPI00124E0B9B|nr:histidine kinase [Serinicoccus kebangsaanensis]
MPPPSRSADQAPLVAGRAPTEPAPPVPPLTRWQHAWRLGLVWLLGALFWLVVVGISTWSREDPAPVSSADRLLLLDLVVGHVVLVLVALRRRWPLGVALAAAALCIVSVWAVPATLLAVMSLATRRRVSPLVGVVALNVAVGVGHEAFVAPVLFAGDPAYRSGQAPWMYVLAGGLLTVLILVIATLVGWNVGARRELLQSSVSRAETAQREQAARVSQARLAERARIAREMHDVMGHRLSLVAMHAGALAHRPDLSEEDRRASAEVVRDGAHQALQELRDVLGVLRADDGAEDEHPGPVESPQPTLTDIPSLVAEATSSGQDVALDADPELWARSVHLPDLVGRHAYRVVQEALTNARKHAPGSGARVQVSGTDGEGLDVVVRNPVGATLTPALSTGLGLTGMAERVHLAGGRFEAGVVEREFVVRVWLPWQTQGTV